MHVPEASLIGREVQKILDGMISPWYTGSQDSCLPLPSIVGGFAIGPRCECAYQALKDVPRKLLRNLGPRLVVLLTNSLHKVALSQRSVIIPSLPCRLVGTWPCMTLRMPGYSRPDKISISRAKLSLNYFCCA